MKHTRTIILLTIFIALNAGENANGQTVALWTFDEPSGLYPSGVVSDLSDNDYPLVLGKGGAIVAGKFGNAIQPVDYVDITYPVQDAHFGLEQLPVPDGRSSAPMSWMNASFAALMTSGENHLRKQVAFPNPTETGLNLGRFDWTVEFWYFPEGDNQDYGVVFEVGTGPRAENQKITSLEVDLNQKGFRLRNKNSRRIISIPSSIPRSQWSHMAFIYHSEGKVLKHYVNGVLQGKPVKARLKKLDHGKEDYLSLARDGNWQHPLPGILDELRFSKGIIYSEDFIPPGSFAPLAKNPSEEAVIQPALPLLFEGIQPEVYELGSRKHLFIDDALISKMEDCSFRVNPPRFDKCVIKDIQGTFRKHLSIIEDEDGLIRMYYGGPDDCLEVRTSRDGIHFDIPDLGTGEFQGKRNVAVKEPTAMGNVFLDPLAPEDERWRFISDFNRRGIYLYSSRDGFSFTRRRTAILPFRSGSQSNSFYDDQQNKYISYHRCDFTSTPEGATRRTFVMTESEIIDRSWDFSPASPADYAKLEGIVNMRTPSPWYLDNGPLTPGGFSIEYPTIFENIDTIDPAESDIYVPKALKYQWAPDVYLAFPLLYFHYEESGDPLRTILFAPDRMKGSGPIETQLSVSRDAKNWTRFPRPAYVGIGVHEGSDIKQAYLAHGLVRRGGEIWQYYFGETRYHSSRVASGYKREVYRLIQRLDGFVSLDSPYEKDGYMVSKPFRFEGVNLVLNVDTDAAGYVQVGFLDKEGIPIPGFTLDECIYINGDFTAAEVEWLQNVEEIQKIEIDDEEDYAKFSGKAIVQKDVSALQGETVQLIFRMRGSKLYAMEFTGNK